MKGLFDLQVPAMRPLWLRVTIVLATLAWTGMEIVNGAWGWAALFGAAGLWCVWQFFVTWDEEKVAAKEDR
ncbi:hypothetical protein [Histidinibacterium aquaticum]|uniref:DUF3329 domain-containing protein n=1 Tax=Histidinibacterium aquaticum TaxID=2613962 RepID=A0A5J5GSW5_9RHOB|nr:hypothetical protein [Histidinibacterium aquaticum]KAA9010733.1 hypothetical protein F3S47_04020 [Histidinibacterium aquaticum]